MAIVALLSVNRNATRRRARPKSVIFGHGYFPPPPRSTFRDARSLINLTQPMSLPMHNALLCKMPQSLRHPPCYVQHEDVRRRLPHEVLMQRTILDYHRAVCHTSMYSNTSLGGVTEHPTTDTTFGCGLTFRSTFNSLLPETGSCCLPGIAVGYRLRAEPSQLRWLLDTTHARRRRTNLARSPRAALARWRSALFRQRLQYLPTRRRLHKRQTNSGLWLSCKSPQQHCEQDHTRKQTRRCYQCDHTTIRM